MASLTSSGQIMAHAMLQKNLNSQCKNGILNTRQAQLTTLKATDWLRQ